MKTYFFILFISLASMATQAALEIDEKLTLRVLKTSNTKKTVLTNRGLEDGLVVGTHAKFFLTEGVIARGVVIKAAPSRSVWSIYRVIDADQLNTDTVMNIKISSELRLTEDPTRSVRVVNEDGEIDRLMMPLPPTSQGMSRVGGSDMPEILTDVDRSELESMGMGRSSKGSVGFGQRTWELWGLMHFNSLSGTVDDDLNGSGDVAQSTLDFSLGIEKYFRSTKGSFLDDVSIFGFFHRRSSETGDSIGISSSWTEFGGGANYHFHGDSKRSDNLVLFGTLSAGIGSVSGTVSMLDGTEDTLEGSSNFFALGAGAKYILSNGWGARAVLDYYQSGEVFALDSGDEITRSLAGPRIQLGVSYRF